MKVSCRNLLPNEDYSGSAHEPWPDGKRDWAAYPDKNEDNLDNLSGYAACALELGDRRVNPLEERIDSGVHVGLAELLEVLGVQRDLPVEAVVASEQVVLALAEVVEGEELHA